MAGGTPSNTTTTSKTELPPWLSQAAQQNIATATNLGNQPFQPYTGSLVAPQNSLQQQAYVSAQGGTNWQPYLSQTRSLLGQAANLTQQGAQGVAAVNPITAGAAPTINAAQAGNAPMAQAAGPVQAGSFLNANVQGYMNPYTQSVLDNSLDAIERQRQQQQVSNAGAATAAGAFGGSRQGVVESLTNEAALRQSGDVASQLNQANFNQAQQAIAADQNRALQAGQFNASNQQQVNLANQAALQGQSQFNANAVQQARLANQAALQGQSQFNAGVLNQGNFFNANLQEQMRQRQLQGAGQLGDITGRYGQLGALQSGLQTSDINLQSQLGNQMQDDAQFGLDQAYQQYLRAQQYPIDMLNLRIGATAQTPYGQSGSVTQPAPTRNRTAGALGGAATGAGLGSAFGPWGTAIGGLLGAGYGYFGG